MTFKRKDKQQLIMLLGELLSNGFTLNQSVKFLTIITNTRSKEYKWLKKELRRGNTLPACLEKLGFTATELAPIHFASIHGDLIGTLKRMNEQMLEKDKQRHHLIKLISYPMVLLICLMCLVLGMKWFILPQLSVLYDEAATQSMGMTVINKGPKWLLVIVLVVGVVGTICLKEINRRSAIFAANLYSRVPFIGGLVKSYYTSLFATEWGALLQQGLSFKEVVLLMKKDEYSPLMQEMAREVEVHLEAGIEVSHPLKKWSFLTPQLSVIVKQGEVNGQLGKELVVYGHREWATFMATSERAMGVLQPLLFVLIAGLIVSIYGALLLPIYNGMSGF